MCFVQSFAKAQECDATADAISTTVRPQKNPCIFILKSIAVNSKGSINLLFI